MTIDDLIYETEEGIAGREIALEWYRKERDRCNSIANRLIGEVRERKSYLRYLKEKAGKL